MDRIEELFCAVDDFCKKFNAEWNYKQIGDGTQKRNRSGRMHVSEMLTILLLFF